MSYFLDINMQVVGGAHEAEHAFPNTNRLVLKKRLGFIKLALRTGSFLVPVFGFGENDLWDQLENPPGNSFFMDHWQSLAIKIDLSFS